MADTEIQANNVKTSPAKMAPNNEALPSGQGADDSRATALEMKARAAEMLKRGTISEAEYDKLVAKADAILAVPVKGSTEIREADNDD